MRHETWEAAIVRYVRWLALPRSISKLEIVPLVQCFDQDRNVDVSRGTRCAVRASWSGAEPGVINSTYKGMKYHFLTGYSSSRGILGSVRTLVERGKQQQTVLTRAFPLTFAKNGGVRVR